MAAVLAKREPIKDGKKIKPDNRAGTLHTDTGLSRSRTKERNQQDKTESKATEAKPTLVISNFTKELPKKW